MIDDAVRRAIAGEASLETLITLGIYGRRPNPAEPVWPPEHRRIWSEAIMRWRIAQMPREVVTIEQIWDAIEQYTAGHEWWIVPNLTWPRLAKMLDVGSRALVYRVRLQGWVIAGGKGRKRRIERAPCQECERPVPAEEIDDRRCLQCRGLKRPRRRKDVSGLRAAAKRKARRRKR